MAAYFCMLKEPDKFLQNKKKLRLKKFHSVINCSGTETREDKCKFRFTDEKYASFRSLVNKTTGSAN